MKRYVKNFNDRIVIDDFVLNMKDSLRFYATTSDRHQNDEKKQVYQHDVRNTKRRLLNQFFNQQQQSRSQYIDQQYLKQQYQQRINNQQFYQSQYIDQQQQQRISYNNNQSNREFRFQFVQTQKSSQQRIQSYSIFDQKLLINQMNHTYFVFENQQQYQINSYYDDAENDFMKFIQNNVNNDIKYSIVAHVNFDEIEQIFNVNANSNE